jgi:hypothetical protein
MRGYEKDRELKQAEIVEELKKVRGAIPLNLDRRSFLTGLGVAAASVAGASALAACSPTSDSPSGTGTADTPPVASGPVTGMAFTGNEGKTMGEVLGAGWLGDEPEIAAADITETLTADIVVCGAGHAGVACARKAAEGGKKVILCEKQTEDGYTTIGADIGHLNSQWQKGVGIPEYDPIEFLNDYQIYCAGRANWDLIRQYATRSGEAFDWFTNTMSTSEKATLAPLNWPVVDGYKQKRGFFGSYLGTANFEKVQYEGDGDAGSVGAALSTPVIRSINKAKDANAEIRYDAAVVKLVHNADNTEVTGVICQSADGKYIQINASSVVLAAGDIGTNIPMFNALCAENYALGEYKDLSAMSMSDGSGIAVALRMGAKVEIGTGGDMGDHMNMMMSILDMTETPWFNRAGKRFCNEAFGGPMLSGIAAAREPGNTFFSIWDGNWKDMLLNQCAGHMTMKHWEPEHLERVELGLNSAIGSGEAGFGYASGPAGVTYENEEGFSPETGSFFYCADTLDELCGYLGMEAGTKANVLASIQKYNADCKTGIDTEFGRPADMMFSIEKGPFYGAVFSKAVGGQSMRLVSLTGLLVSGNQQVLGQGYEPIKGLYATGNNSGGRFPLGYNGILNGVSVGMALTLGYCLGDYLGKGDFANETLGINNKAGGNRSDSA